MLFPLGKPIHLHSTPGDADDEEVLCISCNRERMLFAVLTKTRLMIFWSNPQVLLISFRRTPTSLVEQGLNAKLVWKPDSSAVAISTSIDHLLFFKVDFDFQCPLYETVDVDASTSRSGISNLELIVKDPIPKLKINSGAIVRLSSYCTCMVSLKEELSVALSNGWMHRLLWTGHVLDEFSTSVSSLPFINDQLQSKPEYLRQLPSVHIVSLAYSPILGGYGIVLSNGRAALLTSVSPRYHPSEMRAVWAPNLTDAVCCTINHKYRLLTVGCKNSQVASYHIEESSGALVLTYRVQPQIMENPETVQSLGSVVHIEWSPFCCTAAVCWENGSLGGYSVFGSQLWFIHSMQSKEENVDNIKLSINSFDWGPEGFQLWHNSNSDILVGKFGRPISLDNLAMAQHQRLALICAEEVLLSRPRAAEAQMYAAAQSYWQKVQVPWNYIGYAWPLRFCTLDYVSQTFCVAGSRGLASCNLANGKWKLFRNETQEREFLVTSGMCFWNDFLIASCFDIAQQSDELRFYPRQCNLDNQFSTIHKLEAQVLFLNLRDDVLLAFDIESKCTLFSLKVEETSHRFSKVIVETCAEIMVSDLVGHPACMISAQLISRSTEEGLSTFCGDVDTILLNISGRLVMLSPQNLDRKQTGKEAFANHLEPPMLVASFVENVWIDPYPSPSKPHLTQALWIYCGDRGMRVWMPLFPKGQQSCDQQSRSFISKRIMLPFELSSIYPVAVASADCLVVGIEAFCTELENAARVQRKSEVFLHHLLRQLLKRNLGLYALEIARTSQDLTFFSHVLELLLHSVLEEEATSSEPIPDPLLPRVVAFLQEFPEFLQTVAHCARKTEMALWKHLFQTIGNPKDLFDVCIRENHLETAASYFIILQNMESTLRTKQHATQLLEACLDNSKWAIARDIVRLLKSVDPDDFESPPTTPFVLKQSAASQRVSKAVTHPSVEESDSFIFQPISISIPTRQRQSSISNTSPVELPTGSAVDKGAKTPPNQPLVKKVSLQSIPKSDVSSFGESDLPIDVYLNLILSRHARELLSSLRLYDLGCFTAHLEFHLVLWLNKEKNRAARVNDFTMAVQRLHKDFNWPYPVLTYTLMEQLNKKMQLSPIKDDHQYQMKRSLTTPVEFAPQISLTKQPSQQTVTVNKEGSVDSGMPHIGALSLKKQLKPGETTSTLSTKDTRRLLVKQQQRDLPLPSPDMQTVPLDRKFEMPGTPGASEMTEESWMAADTEAASLVDLDWDGLEQLCGESVARGPHEREVELRFLQQILLESNCLEWSTVICLVLRDLVGLARAVNASSIARSPNDTLRRLKQGLSEIDIWAESYCMGYKPLLHAVQSHLDLFELRKDSSSVKVSET